MLETKYTKEESKILKQLENELQKNLKLAFERCEEAKGNYYSIDLNKEKFSEQELKIIDDYKKANWAEAEILNDYADKVKPIKEKAVKRTLNEYQNNPDEILKALKDDLKERLIQFLAFEQKELSITVFKDDMYKRYRPYLEFLNENAPNSYNDFMTFFELTFKGKNKIIDEAKSKAKQVKDILDDYSPLRQGTLTNEASKITPSKKEFKLNMISETAKFTKGDFTISFSHFEEIMGLKTSTHQLLDACIRELTLRGLQNRTISFHLDDYMALRGLRDKKTARQQVKRDLETLFDARYSFTQKNKNKSRDFMDFRMISKKGIKNAIISVTFTPEFIELLQSYNYNIMYVHELLFKLDNKKYPCAYYFLRKILEHKNMNYWEDNADIISVQTLLKTVECVEHGIPSYEEVAKSNRHYDTRIIDPFENNMDALNEVFTWEYCHSKELPLTDDELQNFNYELFSKLLIKIHWHNYPERDKKTKKLPAKKKENKISNSDKNEFYA